MAKYVKGWLKGFSPNEVIMLNRSPIDKIAAWAMVELHEKRRIPVSGFYAETKCADEQLAAWRRQGILPIDLGSEKYHEHKGFCRSATEFVVRSFGYELSASEHELLNMLGHNNQTGYLRGGDFSVVYLLREFYDLTWQQQRVIEYANRVVKTWLRAREADVPPGRTEEGLAKEMPDLVRVTAGCKSERGYRDLSVGLYLWDLWKLGYATAEIRSDVEWWITGANRLKEQMRRAELELEKRRKDEMFVAENEFYVQNRWRCLWLESDDHFLVKAASRAYDILFTKSSRGHVSIMTANNQGGKLDVRKLGEALQAHEPDRWYIEAGHCINGGRIYIDEPPTAGTRAGITKLAHRYPPELMQKRSR